MQKLLFFFGLILTSPIFLNGQKIIRGFNHQTENDIFAGMFGLKNEDKDYSGGFKFEFFTDYLNNGIFPLFKNRKLNEDGTVYNLNSVYIHGMGYTPPRQSFSMLTPDRAHRPYASIFGIGRKRIAVFDANEDKCFSISNIVSDIFIGKIGTRIPGDVQNFLHEYISNSNIVMGWHNQIGYGGRWAGNYLVKTTFEIKYPKLSKIAIFPRIYFAPQVSFGNIFINCGAKLSLSNRNAGDLATISAIRSNEWNYSAEPEKFNKFIDHFGYEMYFKTQVIGRNSLLTGLPYYDNSIYTVPISNINRVVYDIGFKVLFNYFPDKKSDNKSRSCTAYFELIHRSKEFSYGFDHTFGNIGVCVIFQGLK